MKFYRYKAVSYGSIDEFDNIVSRDICLELNEYDLISETPKGYWIGCNKFYLGKRWVSKTSRKRFAYPTKEEAMTNYIARTTRRISILKAQLNDAEDALMLAKETQEKAVAA